jgi:hypothetical protein
LHGISAATAACTHTRTLASLLLRTLQMRMKAKAKPVIVS